MDNTVAQQIWDNALMVKIVFGIIGVSGVLIAAIHSRHEKKTDKNTSDIESIREDLNEHYIKKDAFIEYKEDRHRRDEKLDKDLEKIAAAANSAATTAQALYQVVEKRGGSGVHRHE